MSQNLLERVEPAPAPPPAPGPVRGLSVGQLLAVAAFAILVTLSGSASAHRVGLSRGEYSVSGAEVRSRLTFARGELEARFGGAGTGSDPSHRAPDSRAAAEPVVALLRVEMAGRPCRAELDSVEAVVPDGVRIAVHQTCPASGAVVFHPDFVDALEPGHRHVAEVTVADRTTTFVAYRGNVAFGVGQATPESFGRPTLGFFRMGIEHILTGWDHLAFLLGVALAPFGLRSAGPAASTRARLRSLALSVTAFTVAHSVTLSLGVLGVTHVAPRWVEPLIALSVAYLGVEGLVSRRATAPYRMTFAFGLVHGLGFAGALREVAVPRSDLPAALALFNAGVEAGQLVALAPVVAALFWLARRPLRLSRALLHASAALALGGAALFIVRAVTAVEEVVAARASTRSRAGISAPTTARKLPAPAALTADVEHLCRTINELPRRRRAECSDQAPGVAFTGNCTRALERAVASGAITLLPDEVGACALSVARRYETCAFVEQGSRAREPACEGILHGGREAGQACASSLECRPGLFCDGAGPLDAGACRPPKENGAACGLGIDPLAGYVQIATDDSHRECGGECVQYRCRDPKASLAASYQLSKRTRLEPSVSDFQR